MLDNINQTQELDGSMLGDKVNDPNFLALKKYEAQYNRDPNILNVGKKPLLPMSPLIASATVVNLLLATGPFTYPYAYVELGPVLSCCILFTTCFLAFITATFLVEAVSVANTV
jgi:hypothetical protein